MNIGVMYVFGAEKKNKNPNRKPKRRRKKKTLK